MNWHELSQSSHRDVVAWAGEQPWGLQMAACQQDAEWHAEGDVWTHTRLVCAELPKLREWPELTESEQRVLLWTALFHDAGKPLTSRREPESGRITSPKHAQKGEHLARQVLRELRCNLQTREEIARLVRFHGRPAFLLEKPHPEHEVIGLSWHVSNKLLYLFALADTRGRTTAAFSRPEENLHLWKLTAEEQECFERRYRFANDQARFLFYRQSDPNLHFTPHENYRCTVTLLSGLPGSGKDTWLAQKRPELPVVALDDLRDELDVAATDNQGEVIQLARERSREYLRAGRSFAFSATNLLRQTRQRWLDLFADYGARIEIVYVEPPLETILKQNQLRPRQVPERVIRTLAEKCNPPTWAEAHDVLLCESATGASAG